MDNLLNNVIAFDNLIRELEKINSKMENGHFILAYDDSNRILSRLQQVRKEILEESQASKKPRNLIEEIETMDKIIRELEKFNSKMKNGNFIFAWRDNRRVIAELHANRKNVIKNFQGENSEK